MIAIINGLKMRCYNNKIRKLPANKRNIKPYLPHSTTDFITDYIINISVKSTHLISRKTALVRCRSYHIDGL